MVVLNQSIKTNLYSAISRVQIGDALWRYARLVLWWVTSCPGSIPISRCRTFISVC